VSAPGNDNGSHAVTLAALSSTANSSPSTDAASKSNGNGAGVPAANGGGGPAKGGGSFTANSGAILKDILKGVVKGNAGK